MPESLNANAGLAYSAELERRFNDLVSWAVDTWPDSSYAISADDFAAARKNVERLRARFEPGMSQDDAAEPSQGGAQYVDVSPTPWP
ncbi:MAG: hypothetical protein ACRYGK_16745 [Janthinobacterium lividum]